MIEILVSFLHIFTSFATDLAFAFSFPACPICRQTISPLDVIRGKTCSIIVAPDEPAKMCHPGCAHKFLDYIERLNRNA